MLVVKNARRRGKVIEILSEEHENYEIIYRQPEIAIYYIFMDFF